MRIQTSLNDDTNFFFAEIEGEEGTAIIIENEEFEFDLFCSIEQAEKLVNQLQKHINKHSLRVIK